MNIPSLHTIRTPTTNPQGELHPAWYGLFSNLIIELQNNLSNEGYVFPKQNSTNVNQLNTTKHIAKILYDSDSKSMKVNNNGTFEEIAVTPPQLTSAEIAAIPPNKINGKFVVNTTTNELMFGIGSVFKTVTLT